MSRGISSAMQAIPRSPRRSIWAVAVALGSVVWLTSYMIDKTSRYYSGDLLERLVERSAHRYDRITTSIAAARAMVFLNDVGSGDWHVQMEDGRLSGLRRGDVTVPLRSAAIRMGYPSPVRPVTAYLDDRLHRWAERFEYRLDGAGSPVLSIPVDEGNCRRVLWSIAMDPVLSRRVETTLDTGDLTSEVDRIWHPFRPVTNPVDGHEPATDQICPDYSYDDREEKRPMSDQILVRLRRGSG